MRKLDANSVTLEMQRQNRTHREKKWIMWLLQVWRVNERKPTWLTVSRQWPKEYETILMEVGPWNIVEYKLEMAHKIQEQTAETKMLTELQKSRALGARCKYSLEDHILGLIKLMEHLQLDRLPTLQELADHATVLGIPHRTSYERQLVTKENWAGCIQNIRRRNRISGQKSCGRWKLTWPNSARHVGNAMAYGRRRCNSMVMTASSVCRIWLRSINTSSGSRRASKLTNTPKKTT